MVQRVILHLDLDAFFCSVEEQRNPSLKGKAFAVGGSPDKRGVVASCSYPARQFGVRSAMPMSRAVQLCPGLIVVRHHFQDYQVMSRKVMAILHETTPFVEQLSIDEAFLDMTGFEEDSASLAYHLQARINTELNLSCSLGVASNKLVAKIANNLGKDRKRGNHPPNAVEIVPPGTEAEYLAQLPIRELWGVGPKTAEHMNKLGIHTIGDIAQQSETFLIQHFGKNGYDLFLRSKGIDGRPVETDRATKSVSKEITYEKDVSDHETLVRTLRQLADGVGRQLRKSGLRGTTVKIKVRWTDFTTLTRQITLKSPVQEDRIIYEAALELLDHVWDGLRAIRLIGVGVSGFENSAKQLSLFEGEEEQTEQHLQDALDTIRDRFGDSVLKRGSDLIE